MQHVSLEKIPKITDTLWKYILSLLICYDLQRSYCRGGHDSHNSRKESIWDILVAYPRSTVGAIKKIDADSSQFVQLCRLARESCYGKSPVTVYKMTTVYSHTRGFKNCKDCIARVINVYTYQLFQNTAFKSFHDPYILLENLAPGVMFLRFFKRYQIKRLDLQAIICFVYLVIF